MLDNSYKNRQNAIEEVIYDFLKDCDLIEISKDVSHIYSQICLMPTDIKLQKKDKSFVFFLLEEKISNSFTFTLTDERVLLSINLFSENVFHATIYLWYIQAWCFKNNIRNVDFEIFKNGIFDNKDLKSVWENQKIQAKNFESSNLVDYPSAGLSVQFLN